MQREKDKQEKEDKRERDKKEREQIANAKKAVIILMGSLDVLRVLAI